jgi:hemerythrin-like domain-containing protein
MDAIKLLKQDHRRVEELFAEFEALGERAHKSKAKVVAKILLELRTHAELEEAIFYPAFRPEAEEEQDVLEAYEEHHIAKVLMNEIEALAPDHERYTAKVIVLKELIAHHVEEEEKEMVPEAKKALGAGEINALGDRMEAAKPDVQARMAGRVPTISVTMLEATPAKKARKV